MKANLFKSEDVFEVVKFEVGKMSIKHTDQKFQIPSISLALVRTLDIA